MDKLDELDEKEIARLCAERGCRYDIHTVAETGSTNDELKALAANGTADGYALIAGSQTAGRGRSGHSFFSPGSGIYLSVLLRPNTPPEETLHLTAAAGCA
nr:biotin--[acetyl-CoA-carboxylase] ligase [Ruminococcus sp.]